MHVFPGKEWDDTVDYMFVRNNVPNETKLSTKLQPSIDGASAYCCQCTWTHTKEERVITQGVATDPQWMCAGH